LQIGNGVKPRVTIPCEPCVKLNRIRSSLAKEVSNNRGILARVLVGGIITRGDRIMLIKMKLPQIPMRISERIYQLLYKVPLGLVINYSQITLSIGVQKSYARVIPKTLKLAPGDVPIHRVVSSCGALIQTHIPHQLQMLVTEGVGVDSKGNVKREFIVNDDLFRFEERSILT